jgi:hypothetical protein
MNFRSKLVGSIFISLIGVQWHTDPARIYSLHVAVLKNGPDRQDSDRIRVPLNAAMDWYSKIPWYPKLLFQRENALASFWVQRVLVTHQDPPG